MSITDPYYRDTRPVLTPEVASDLRAVATILYDVCHWWRENDQRAFERSRTQIGRAFGMSIDELAAEILAVIEKVCASQGFILGPAVKELEVGRASCRERV